MRDTAMTNPQPTGGCFVICKTPVKCERQIPLAPSMLEPNRTIFRAPEDPTPLKCVWCGGINDYFQADVREWKLYFPETIEPMPSTKESRTGQPIRKIMFVEEE